MLPVASLSSLGNSGVNGPTKARDAIAFCVWGAIDLLTMLLELVEFFLVALASGMEPPSHFFVDLVASIIFGVVPLEVALGPSWSSEPACSPSQSCDAVIMTMNLYGGVHEIKSRGQHKETQSFLDSSVPLEDNNPTSCALMIAYWLSNRDTREIPSRIQQWSRSGLYL
jgi:hypothetical protein